MAHVNVSVLDKAARVREGRHLSAIVEREAQLATSLLTTEAWSPTLFSKPRRAIVNFLEAQVVGIDVDETLALADAIAKLKDYAVIIGTSQNHQRVKGDKPACDRYRIICKLSEPIYSAADYTATLLAIAKRFGIPADEQAKDAARWFIPCREVVYDNMANGKTFEPVAAATTLPVSRPTSQLAGVSGERGTPSRATMSFVTMYKITPNAFSNWHGEFFKAAVDLKEQGFTESEAALMLAQASPHGALDDTDLEQLVDVFNNRGGALGVRPAWPVMIPGTQSKPPYPAPTSPVNMRYMLKDVLGFNFHRNERRGVIYLVHADGKYKPLTDHILSSFKTRAREHGLSADIVLDTVTDDASSNSFDPLLAPFDLLQWDGRDYITELFDTMTLPDYTTAEQLEWYRIFFERWLIGAVTKIYRPGAQNNVLVFFGEQGAGKSRWLSKLANAVWEEGFGEGSINPENKDHELRHIDNFIWHVAEFDNTSGKREVGALKDYFTKERITLRRPYERLPITASSICSFCASVNTPEFLHDGTGNRRYLVIPVLGVNAEHTVNLPQVWAQAKALMEAGGRAWFDRDEIAVVNAMNEVYMSREEYVIQLDEKLAAGDDPLTVKQILVALGGDFEDMQLTKGVRSNIVTLMNKKKIKPATRGKNSLFLVDEKLLKAKPKKAGKQ